MAKIIVTSRYLKSGKRGKIKRSNYTKYIATRESVEKRPQIKAATTEKQVQLISELIKEFPMAKQYLEYADYVAKPTVENASELISTIIERHADVIGNRKNFVGYMAMRPGSERRGEHGLFSDSDEPIDLNAVANEVAEHPGYIWTHVVSLRREDAIRLGYTNSDMWRDLVMRHIQDIANAQKIETANLKWYAAFHDTTHHPHIHLIVYSADPRQGYLTKDGIDKIRSVFANDIFHDDLQSIYQAQTLSRNELKALSEDNMNEIIAQLGGGSFDERFVSSIQRLLEQLKTTKGKKVYGYLPKDVKHTIDEVFTLLSENENIQKLYDNWCEFEKAKYRMYTQKDKEFPTLVDNKEFSSVRNMIIKTVMKMNSAQVVPEEPEFIDIKDDVDVQVEETTQQLVTNNTSDTVSRERIVKRKQAKKFIDSSDEKQDISKGIKMLTELADSGDTFASYKLGKIYLNGDIVYSDYANAEKYLRQATEDNGYAMYALAKLYLTDERNNLSEAVKLLEKTCEYEKIRHYAAYVYAKILLGDNEYHNTEKAVLLLKENSTSNNWCSYMLGKLYLFGNDNIEINRAEAVRWINMSAEAGNEYAQQLLDYSDNNCSAMLTSTVSSLIINLGRIIEEDNRRSRKNISRADRKLMRIIKKKKQELGIKSDNIERQYEY